MSFVGLGNILLDHELGVDKGFVDVQNQHVLLSARDLHGGRQLDRWQVRREHLGHFELAKTLPEEKLFERSMVVVIVEVHSFVQVVVTTVRMDIDFYNRKPFRTLAHGKWDCWVKAWVNDAGVRVIFGGGRSIEQLDRP